MPNSKPRMPRRTSRSSWWVRGLPTASPPRLTHDRYSDDRRRDAQGGRRPPAGRGAGPRAAGPCGYDPARRGGRDRRSNFGDARSRRTRHAGIPRTARTSACPDRRHYTPKRRGRHRECHAVRRQRRRTAAVLAPEVGPSWLCGRKHCARPRRMPVLAARIRVSRLRITISISDSRHLHAASSMHSGTAVRRHAKRTLRPFDLLRNIGARRRAPRVANDRMRSYPYVFAPGSMPQRVLLTVPAAAKRVARAVAARPRHRLLRQFPEISTAFC